jgi:hypothetical protein
MAQPDEIAELEPGLKESCPLLRKPQKPGAQAPGQEGGLELQSAEGTTGGAATDNKEGQKDVVKSKAEEAERSSCVKGRSGGAAEASVDATDAGAWGDPP